MQKTIVLLLADKRSGTTMFHSEICKHPEISPIAYSPHNIEVHHWTKAAVILGAGKREITGYGSPSSACTYMIDCIKQNIPGFQIPSTDHALVFEGWEALCNKFARPVLFEKTPHRLGQWASLSLLLEWVNHTNFIVKFIGLVRNPLSVQYSAYQLFQTDPVQRQYSWLNMYKNLLAFQHFIPKENFIIVRYEDIVKKPTETFEEISDFIRVSRLHDLGQDIHAKSLSKWKDDPYFNIQLDPVVKQLAKYFGYSEANLDNPDKLEPPLAYRIKQRYHKIYNLIKSRLMKTVKSLYLRLRLKFSKSR